MRGIVIFLYFVRKFNFSDKVKCLMYVGKCVLGKYDYKV